MILIAFCIISVIAIACFVWALFVTKDAKPTQADSVEDIAFAERLEEIHRRQREIREGYKSSLDD